METRNSRWAKKLRIKIILGIVVSMALIILVINHVLQQKLLEDSKHKTGELSNAIHLSLRSQMLQGAPSGMFQQTLEHMVDARSTIIGIYILKPDGTVSFSSKRTKLDVQMNEICIDCHRDGETVPEQSTLVYVSKERKIHRNISVIRNEPDCIGCHAGEDVLGKIVIDRSLEDTYDLVSTVQWIMLGSGAFVLFVLGPALYASITGYIKKLRRQGEELSLMHNMIERLSNTIDTSELITITTGIIREFFDADEVDIVIPTFEDKYIIKHWDSSSRGISRKKLADGDPLKKVINGWLKEEMNEPLVEEDRRTAYIPAQKGGNRLVLIVLRRQSGPLNPAGLRLIDTLSAHSAVAFENARLYYMAITDELTHMFTSRHFRHCIYKEHVTSDEKNNGLVLIMMDIDNFKDVNDTYGHPCGDDILRGVAERVLGCMRSDERAFRYGGEEFAVIMQSAGSSEGMTLAERIRLKVYSVPFRTNCGDLHISLSLGVASIDVKGCASPEDINDLIARADKALYEAKRTGKNKVVVDT